MKKSLVALVAALGACCMAAQGAEAKSLEEVLKDKGVITEADYQEIVKSQPKFDYKIGKGFSVTSPDEKFKLNIGGLLMVRYMFADNDTAKDVSQFTLKKGRVWFQGYAFTKDLEYRLQLAFENSGSGKMLEYAYVKYNFLKELQIAAGQSKPIFGRQNMSSVASLQMVDVAPVVKAFSPGYDLGAYATGKFFGGIVNYDMSVSNGAGQTTARSSNNNAFLAHLQVNPLGFMGWGEGDNGISKKPLVTIGSAYYRNTLARSGTGFETNNLGYASTSSGWLGKNAAFFNAAEKVDIDSVNIDAAFKWMGASLQAEYFWGQADGQITDSTVRAQGYYAQAGYMILPKLEVAMRYSYLDPNRDQADDNITEILGGVSYYFSGHALKLQADVGNIHTQKSMGVATDDMQYRVQMRVSF